MGSTFIPSPSNRIVLLMNWHAATFNLFRPHARPYTLVPAESRSSIQFKSGMSLERSSVWKCVILWSPKSVTRQALRER